ncbi:UbiA family prenyltransferase [Dyadobacter arcticus]|uniref:Naringenin-chalcone synthase/4-hydroxybenzoate polyprenyltransferase n=1 Tax=Dyadobacter arcticus TaxID=1078754 RepID=A0ABX0UQ51_9BACT|nr:UbiA family prenyltransferase [Dyadobacter arcticus]NIJ55087.1 putative naringenin-chalcone synthase/4-hydroxybenzoate polyprenyltransferase [Dyadobacter arcticus]
MEGMLIDGNTIKLLRIPFSFFLMPLFLFAYSQAENILHHQALWSFLIIHLLVYPASNGYNSFVDRDEGSIGGLEKPPMPTIQLFYLTVFMDAAATLLALIFVNALFAFCLVLYIGASRAYSSRLIRLKRYPIAGFLTVAFFQGAFTYYMSVAGVSGNGLPLSRENIYVLLGCSFQIAGAYPLTQVYQHEQDLKDGITTLSYKLGYLGTFLFTGLMFLLCNVFYYLYFTAKGIGMIFYIIQVFFIPIVLYFGYWFYQVWKDRKQANFSNTMRMNWIASICMNGCFLVLIIINRIPLSYISAIETAVPDHCYTQEALSEFYIRSTDDLINKRKIRIVAGKTGIEKRYSVLSDFDQTPANYQFFNQSADLLPEPNLTQRMRVYQEHATKLSIKAIEKIRDFHQIKHSISHLITVTCTGLSAPGLDVELMRELHLKPTIQRSSINFMGCNAAIIALKNADAICKSQPNARVLVVCTELCTIHFQKQYNDDYLLSNLLFGDGSVAVLVDSKPSRNYIHEVEINTFNSMILHNGYSDMAWRLSETGFIMNLSSYVPDLIRKSIKPMLAAVGLEPDDYKHWAVHPGGKRIVDDFAAALELDKCFLAPTYNVLKNYGNMSSPTVLFVLKDVIEKAKPENQGNRIFAAAFGPGLSIETMQLSYV